MQFTKVKTFKSLNIILVTLLTLTVVVHGDAQKNPEKKLAKAKVLYEEEHLPNDALEIYEEVRKDASMSKMMSGKEKYATFALGISVILTAILQYRMTDMFGTVGTAWATVGGMLFQQLLMWAMWLRKKT